MAGFRLHPRRDFSEDAVANGPMPFVLQHHQSMLGRLGGLEAVFMSLESKDASLFGQPRIASGSPGQACRPTGIEDQRDPFCMGVLERNAHR